MTLRRPFMIGLATLTACTLSASGPDAGPAGTTAVTLTWTADRYGQFSWDYANQQAGLSEAVGTDGNVYTDWRRPTLAEA